ncbi:TIGR04104 family putative zinc finger protein [Lysinibacillus sp. NPDC097214]|uniref:TIGR04104 family putative zinc finger protein n=1 Tax=Lysinibacillus sp. NPDC097214 TaxID=3390584 RepID=UPI003D07D496
MNQFKEDVLKELREVKLTDEKKLMIAQKARSKTKQRRSSPWQYRVVLATFTLFVIGFSYLLSQNKHSGSHQAASLQQETDTWSLWSILQYDLVKGILLFSFMVGLAFFIKWVLIKKGYGLPVCIECGETWSEKQARKMYRKNGQIECPYCGKKQYRSKKSMKMGGILTFPIPLMVFMHLIFDNISIGTIFFMAGVLIYFRLLAPYVFDLQEDDPINDPLW